MKRNLIALFFAVILAFSLAIPAFASEESQLYVPLGLPDPESIIIDTTSETFGTTRGINAHFPFSYYGNVKDLVVTDSTTKYFYNYDLTGGKLIITGSNISFSPYTNNTSGRAGACYWDGQGGIYATNPGLYYQWTNVAGNYTKQFTVSRPSGNFGDYIRYLGFLKNVSGGGTLTLSGNFSLST